MIFENSDIHSKVKLINFWEPAAADLCKDEKMTLQNDVVVVVVDVLEDVLTRQQIVTTHLHKRPRSRSNKICIIIRCCSNFYYYLLR